MGERSALATDTERHPENDTAGTLISEWIDHCPKRPPGTVIGQVGKHLKTMLAEGIDPDDLRRGLAAWHAKGLHPSTLPSVVNETMNTRPDQARALLAAVGADVIPMRPATGDIRAAANLALVEELRALEAAQEQP